MKQSELMINYAFSFLGIPYKWGGNHPKEGLDCSGLVCELLRAFDFIKGDYTAAQIHDLDWVKSRILLNDVKMPYVAIPSCSVLFFGRNGNISHIALAIGHGLMIEAGGGDSHTIDEQSAIDHMAFIRLRPIASRKDLASVARLYLED